MGKIEINDSLVNKAREHAQKIAKDVQVFVDGHTTVATERTICRLFGIDGVNEMGVQNTLWV